MLVIQMRTVDRREVAKVEIKNGETLEQVVQQEIQKAFKNGDIEKIANSPNIPQIAVFEEGDPGSIALFTVEGQEVTYRDATIKAEENANGNMTYTVFAKDKDKEDQLLGVFFTEDRARMAMSLWRSGVFA